MLLSLFELQKETPQGQGGYFFLMKEESRGRFKEVADSERCEKEHAELAFDFHAPRHWWGVAGGVGARETDSNPHRRPFPPKGGLIQTLAPPPPAAPATLLWPLARAQGCSRGHCGHLGLGAAFFRGAVLCTVRCLAAALAASPDAFRHRPMSPCMRVHMYTHMCTCSRVCVCACRFSVVRNRGYSWCCLLTYHSIACASHCFFF